MKSLRVAHITRSPPITGLIHYVPVKHQWDHYGNPAIPLNHIHLRPEAPHWHWAPVKGHTVL